MLRAEIFQTSKAPPDALWAVVGNPWRLAEWTDAESVRSVDPEPVAVGTSVVTIKAGGQREWRVVTAEPRLLELRTDTARGALGVGCRVALDPVGSRLILAAGLDTSGLRARLVDLPALRRRLDRWCAAAVAAANTTVS